ncbi:YesL family protein [Blautia sp. MSJ-19]|uniref:YesL family protein n=1 Tax=Blautia sp. MSJ-19 TaxID=2841517 RepID=UPI001C0E9917|nr:YesL family protein [Blautia sp. MSJ-19]MBU5480189.1 YesL family protein [Blautia sp. MSJ-19]
MAFKDTFRGDSTYSQIMTKVFDIFWLSVISILCCIPVITIGASLSSLYYVMLKLVRDEETAVTRNYFKAFKQNFVQSLPVTLFLLVIIGILTADFHILGQNGSQNASIIYGCCVVILLAAAAVFSYVFPLMARYQNTLRRTFENAARLAASHLWQTVVMVVVNLFPLGWFLISAETFAAVFWIWVFVGMGIQAFVNSLIIRKIFDKLEVEN